MLSIRLLGAPQITYDDHPVTITRRKGRALIYFLAAQAAPLTREQLFPFFWPDHDRSTAQQNLRATLYGLRKILGSLLLVDEDTLALAPDIWVDTRVFEAQLAAPGQDLPQLRETLDLYRGDFLSGFTLADLPEFDDWVTVERERYRRLAVTGLIRLSQLYESRRDFRAGLEVLDQVLASDPLQEDLQRLALRLHYLAGDRAGAIRRYEKFRQLLAEEMGVPPMEETRALYDAIITDTFNPEILPTSSGRAVGTAPARRAAPAVQSLPFVGREAELQKLQDLTGPSRLVLIEGEAGIGKSRLIEQFIQHRPQPFLALVGQARELESTLPYHPIIEALRGMLNHPNWPALRLNLQLPPVWQTEAARLLPELALTPPGPAASHALDEIRLWEGVSQLLLALARQMPLILALDNLHWADSASLGLLGYLIRKAGQHHAPISFVATTRPVESGSPLATFLAALLREDQLDRLALNRLVPSEITLLAQHLAGPTQAPLLADWLSQNSEGNPFILVELVRYARDHNLLREDGQFILTNAPDAPVVPETVYQLIQARLARLSKPAWQVLSAATVLGREFDFEIVAQAVRLPDAAVLDSLEELQRRDLIYPLEGSRYRFDHYLTRQVASLEIGEPRHRLYHRRVAEAMESIYGRHLDSAAGLLAYHFAAGGVLEKAALYAFQAGQRAADLAAWSEAIAFFEQALARFESLNDRRQRLAVLTALGKACLQAGQHARASAALRAALDQAAQADNSAGEGILYLNLAEALLLENRYDEVLALAEELLARGRPEYIANAEYFKGMALSHAGADLSVAIRHIQKAEACLSDLNGRGTSSQPAEGVVTLGQLKFELGNILAREGDLATAIQHYRDGLEVTRQLENDLMVRMHILLHNNLAYHLNLQQNQTAALEHARLGISLAEEKGVLSSLPYLWSTLGEIALAQHDLSSAEQYFTEGLSLARQFGAPERIAGLTANLGLIAKQRGQHALAIDRLSTALAQAEAINFRYLITQIRLWLVPLLAPAEARAQLAAARLMAQQDGYRGLLAQADRLAGEIQ